MTSSHANATQRVSVRFALLLGAVLACTLLIAVPSAFAANFDPELVISDANLRDSDSMTQAQIQAFLDSKPGVLKSLVTADHTGRRLSASQIIFDACQNYRISPKAMLALLQKENSLITDPSPGQRKLDRAIGAGCPNGHTNNSPGFGNQIWDGARRLDGYGEGKTTSYIPLWVPGMKRDVHEGTVTPKNLATFKLYVYNPVIGARAPYGDLSAQSGSLTGNASYWWIYNRYFGDPLADPAVTIPKPAATAPAANEPRAAKRAFRLQAKVRPERVFGDAGSDVGSVETTYVPEWRTLHVSDAPPALLWSL